MAKPKNPKLEKILNDLPPKPVAADELGPDQEKSAPRADVVRVPNENEIEVSPGVFVYVSPLNVELAKGPVGIASMMVRVRFRCEGFSDEETANLARSIALLMAVYGVGPKDPRISAWLFLTMNLLMIAKPRLEKRAAEIEAAAAKRADPAPAQVEVAAPGGDAATS